MKTSNKVLLSLFIAVLLIITSIHVALTQKYKNGKFTIARSGPKKDSITIKPVNYVRLNGLENVVLVPSDSYRLELEKNMPLSFRYYVSGDTLIVTGDTSISSGSDNNRHRIYQEISLHLPEFSMIVAENTSLSIVGKLDTTKGGVTRVELNESRLLFGNRINEQDAAMYFGDVFVTAKQRSEVDLSSNKIHFNTLSFELEKSIFRDNEVGGIKNLMIKADDSSLVQISGQNLQKLKFP
ncbi:hypothetical protein [Flavitalea sp.]|nr:hypothetical protein [Flavitalea sp.]